MFYVYLIKSISHPEQKYIGQTDDLKKRLKQHNAGYSIHTAKYNPWELVNYWENYGFDGFHYVNNEEDNHNVSKIDSLQNLLPAPLFVYIIVNRLKNTKGLI